QAEAYLMNNRLRVLGGLRHEHTKIEGEGLLYDPNRVYVRNPDGSFAYNSQGQRIRKPEAGAAASLEEALYTRTERGYTAQRSYDGYYPGLHLTYNIRENLIGRLAYARTYGRPGFQDIIPNAN